MNSVETRTLGKRETEIRLTRGQVPTEPILKAVERAGWNLSHLAEPRMIYRWKLTGYIPFYSADTLMTKADLNIRWHLNPELKELYFKVNLNVPKNYSPSRYPGSPVLHGDEAKYKQGCRCIVCEDGQYGRDRKRAKPQAKPCKHCKTLFEPGIYNRRQIYCSSKCKYAVRNEKRRAS